MAEKNITQNKNKRWDERFKAILIEESEDNMVGLRSAQRNSHIYARIAETLKLNGYNEVTGKDVKSKVDNMLRKYRIELKVTGPSGGTPSKWKYFARLSRFLGGVKSINFTPTYFDSAKYDGVRAGTPYLDEVESYENASCSRASSLPRSIRSSSLPCSEQPSCSRASSLPPLENSDATPNKNRKVGKQADITLQQELLEQNKERNDAMVGIAESQLKILTNLSEVMERLSNSTTKFQEEILKKL